MYWVIRDVCSLEWGPEQEKSLWQIQSAVQGALGSYDLADPTRLKLPIIDRGAV